MIMETVTHAISSIPYPHTINDTIYILLHLGLYTLVLYGLYDQFIRETIRTIIQTTTSRVRDVYRRITSYAWQKRNILTAKIKRRFKPPKPGEPQTIHMMSIASGTTVSSSLKAQIKRGEGSWTYFTLAWTVISVVFAAVDDMYQPDNLKDWTLLILVVDIAGSLWLCFYCRWFRNKIIGITNHRNTNFD